MTGSGPYPYTQDMLDSINNDPDFMNTIITGVRVRWKSNESTEHYTSLKCCLALTDAIDRQEKMLACAWRFNVASCKRATLKSTRWIRNNTYENKNDCDARILFIRILFWELFSEGVMLVHSCLTWNCTYSVFFSLFCPLESSKDSLYPVDNREFLSPWW